MGNAGSRWIITELGARGDGQTLNTTVIQQAIESAYAAGGGVVVLPPGRYVTGTLFLRTRVTLEILPGAVLLGSPHLRDYVRCSEEDGDRTPYHLLVLRDLENVCIHGGGTIDGNGPTFWTPPAAGSRWHGANNPHRPSPMVDAQRCRNLRISDISIANSGGWTCHFRHCERVFIRGVQIDNNLFGPNTDGFDLTGCKDVLISDCRIDTGDDAICLKTDDDGHTCERVVVTNCILRTNCVALKLGESGSYCDMRSIAFSNCVVFGSTRAVGIYCTNGATYDGILISNINCDTNTGFVLNRPVHIDLRRRTDDARIGRIRNVTISNFYARTDGRILMTAADGAMLENIVLRDIHLSYPTVDDPAPVGADAGSAQFSNRSPEARVARGAVVADSIRNLQIHNLTIEWPTGPTPTDWMHPGSTHPADARGRGTIPPTPVIWGRNLQGGLIDCPLAQSNPPGVARYHLRGSDIRIRE